jgi:hypothetical protein
MREKTTATPHVSFVGVTIKAMEIRDMLGKCFASGFVLKNCGKKTRTTIAQDLSQPPK